MVIREEIEINAPLNVVRRIFSQMEDWDSWNTASRSRCITTGGESLSAGTCFSFVIRPLGVSSEGSRKSAALARRHTRVRRTSDSVDLSPL
jgi:hypothetical protein